MEVAMSSGSRVSLFWPAWVTAILFTSMLQGLNAQFYQWTCSPLDASNNSYTLPYFPILGSQTISSGFAVSLLFESSGTGLVYIQPVPSTLNCTGTVSSIQFCYDPTSSVDGEVQGTIFTLLILEQNALTFTIVNSIRITSTSTTDSCAISGSFCCDSFTLDTPDHFDLPASNFAFGIVPSSGATLFRFRNPPLFFRQYAYLVDHFTTSQEIDEDVESFTLNNADREADETLRLLQFNIVPRPPVTTTTTTSISTTGELTEGIINILGVGGGGDPITTDHDENGDNNSDASVVRMGFNTTTTTEASTDASGLGVRSIVTVATGSGVGVAIVIVAVLLVVVVMVKRRSKNAGLKNRSLSNIKSSPYYYNFTPPGLMQLELRDTHDVTHDTPYVQQTDLNSPHIHEDADAELADYDDNINRSTVYDYVRFERLDIKTFPNRAYGMTITEQTHK